MLTKTGNWFGSLTAPSEKPKTDDSDSLGNDFRAIPTEEDKRAMRRQGSLQRSDSARGSGRRGKGKDSERNRFRRPSVSDEEVNDTPPGSPAYLSDDELYRSDENKVRRRVVKFKGHEELDHAPPGRHPGTMPNRSGQVNQGPGRGVTMPGQGPGIRPGHPQPQGPGVRPGGPQGRGMHVPGNQQPSFPPQQQGSSFTAVGHPGTSPTSRTAFPGPQQQGPRGGMSPNQPRPGFGMRGPQGPQQQRFQAPPQQNAVGYGRGTPPGGQPGVPSPGQPVQPGQPGYGRGGPPGTQPTTQYNLGPRPGAYGPQGSPRPQGGFTPNHIGGPQQAPGSPRPGDRMGPQGPRAGAPPGMTQMGPRFGPGGQPRHGMPTDQQGGQQQHPGQLGSARPGQVSGQLGSPRPGQGPGQLGSPRDGQVPGQLGLPRPGQVHGQLGSPRPGHVPGQPGSPRDGQVPGQLGSPRPGHVPGQLGSPRPGHGPGQLGSPRDAQVSGQLGTPRPGAPLDQQPRGQMSSPRTGPAMEQIRAPAPMGSPRLGSPRNQSGAPQQAPFSDKVRGQSDNSVDQTRLGQSGSSPHEPGLEQPRGPYGNQQQGPHMDQPRPGQFGSSQQAPIMDQGRPRFGSPEKVTMGDNPTGRQQMPDSRNGYSPDAQSTGVHRLVYTLA